MALLYPHYWVSTLLTTLCRRPWRPAATWPVTHHRHQDLGKDQPMMPTLEDANDWYHWSIIWHHWPLFQLLKRFQKRKLPRSSLVSNGGSWKDGSGIWSAPTRGWDLDTLDLWYRQLPNNALTTRRESPLGMYEFLSTMVICYRNSWERAIENE